MPHTLLLADDSVTIQRVIELTFADEDVQVIAVSDGDQAIERLEAAPPDIVLADIGMPGRNGYEVAKYIKQSPRLAHIPVMLLTGAFEPVDQARAAEAGCDGVLAKPFEPQLVISRVKELLARSRRALDATAAGPSAAQAADHWSPAPVPATVASVPGPVGPPAIPPDIEAVSSPEITVVGPPVISVPASPLVVSEPASSEPAQTLDNYFDRLDAAFSHFTGEPAREPAKADAASTKPLPMPDEIDWFGGGGTKTDAAAPVPGWDLPAREWDLPAPATETPDLPLSDFAAVAPASVTVTAPAMPPEPAEAPAPLAHVESSPVSEPFTPPETVAPSETVQPPETVAPSSPEPAETPAPFEHVEWSPRSELVELQDSVAPSSPQEEPYVGRPSAAAVASPAPEAPPPAALAPAVIHAMPTLADAFAALLAAEKDDGLPLVAPMWPVSAPSPSLSADEIVEQVTRRVLEHLSDRVVREMVADIASSVAERLVREEIERIKASIQ